MQRKAGENDPAPGTLPSCSQDTDMRPALDLAALLAEVRISKSILEALRKVQKAFTIRTAN